MPPKKRKFASKRGVQISPPSPVSPPPNNTSHVGSLEDASNLGKGLLALPTELWMETLDNFPAIKPRTTIPHSGPVWPPRFLERTDVLRALSQVSVTYRRAFLPLLWESLDICCSARPRSSSSRPPIFLKHVAETLLRKCGGFAVSPDLASYVRKIHVVLSRYKSAAVVPTFSSTIALFQNLHTLHVLHADTQMTAAIKNGFKGVTLPSIRTLIIPDFCHEILRCCPGATTVWCIRDDGSKLVSVIAKHCREVEEMRGFQVKGNENLMKRIVKAAPNLRVLDMSSKSGYEVVLSHLPSFKKFNTLIIKAPMVPRAFLPEHVQKCIRDAESGFKDLPATSERRYIRLWHVPSSELYNIVGIEVPLRSDYYSSVDLY
ncbi:hypothetical protein BDZ97DRAFT_1853540 [Flammula alnicola]|nr:hypothetical protein BDZ97DRAFT_1853540 [Flammula alnicola]